MKRKLVLFMAAAFLVSNLTACKNSENTLSSDNDKSRSTQSSISESVSESTESDTQSKTEVQSEINEYDGTFNEDVFDKIVSNVVIGDKTFSFPCSLDDLGDGFTFRKETMIYEEETELRSCGLLYDKKSLAAVTMHCAADDNDYSDNDIICISFTASAFKRQDTIDNISIGGITFDSTEEEILQMFGEPIDKYEDSDDFELYIYSIDNKRMTLSFNSGNLNIIEFKLGGK